MDRDEMLHAVGRNAATAVEIGQAVLADAAQRLAPYVAQAGERITPAIREAQIRGARAAAHTLDKVQPTIDEALRQAAPLADAAVKRVAPVVEDILTRIPPAVEAARGKVQDDLLPRLADTLAAIARQPLAAEVAPALAAATAAVHAELRRPTKKKRSFGKTFGVFALVAAVIGAVVIAVKKALEPPDAGWVTHTPADAYIADPVEAADEPAAEPDEADDEPTEPQPAVGSDDSSPFGPGSYVGDEPPEGYTVKGNSRSMKYHVPGQAMYARTTAEVWFDSAATAEKAGFTPVAR